MEQQSVPRDAKPFPVKVIEYDGQTGKVKAIEDDGVPYEFWAPAFFGGQAAPYPKIGDTIMIRWNRLHKRVSEAWKPKPAERYEVPAASFL